MLISFFYRDTFKLKGREQLNTSFVLKCYPLPIQLFSTEFFEIIAGFHYFFFVAEAFAILSIIPRMAIASCGRRLVLTSITLIPSSDIDRVTVA